MKRLFVVTGVAMVGLVVAIAAFSDTTTEEATGETVTEAVVPKSCLRALDLADRGFTLAGEGFGITARILDAASRFDVAAMDRQTRALTRSSTELEKLVGPYTDAKAECRR